MTKSWWKEEPRIVLDLDGTIAEFAIGDDIYKIGKPYPWAKEFVRKLRELGKVILYTSRTNPEVMGEEYAVKARDYIQNWLLEHDIEVDQIANGHKPVGHVYIDDRAVYCSPKHNNSEEIYKLVLDIVHKRIKDFKAEVNKFEKLYFLSSRFFKGM